MHFFIVLHRFAATFLQHNNNHSHVLVCVFFSAWMMVFVCSSACIFRLYESLCELSANSSRRLDWIFRHCIVQSNNYGKLLTFNFYCIHRTNFVWLGLTLPLYRMRAICSWTLIRTELLIIMVHSFSPVAFVVVLSIVRTSSSFSYCSFAVCIVHYLHCSTSLDWKWHSMQKMGEIQLNNSCNMQLYCQQKISMRNENTNVNYSYRTMLLDLSASTKLQLSWRAFVWFLLIS